MNIMVVTKQRTVLMFWILFINFYFMSNKELYSELSESCWISKNKVKQIFEAYSNLVFKNILKWEKAVLPWIGRFTVWFRKGRKWTNPFNGKEITIEPNLGLWFKKSRRFKLDQESTLVRAKVLSPVTIYGDSYNTWDIIEKFYWNIKEELNNWKLKLMK